MSGRRSLRRRRQRRGVWWLLLGLVSAGLLGLLYFRRREDDEAEAAGAAPRPSPPPPSGSQPECAYWLAGPAGNLYVRELAGGVGGAGVPLLLVHGLGGSGGQWAAQLDHLRRAGRRAVALDLRGHGASEPADDGDYAIEALCGDVAAVADQAGLRRFVLAGHSLGALVAIEYAGRHPDRVAALLLVDPNGDATLLPAATVESFLAAVRADPHRELESSFRQVLVNADPAAASRVLEELRETDPEALAGALSSGHRHSPLAALDAYPGPKLSVVSDWNDLPVSLHKLRPTLPVRWIPETGHWLMMDRPDLFNRVMDEFLATVG